MTTSSLGALVRHRRLSLGLSPGQLAVRVGHLGQIIDIDGLEGGCVGELSSDLLAAVAIALHWPPALLFVASDTPIPAPPIVRTVLRSGQAVTDWFDEEQITMMQAEVEGVRALQEALREWTQELADRIGALQRSGPSWAESGDGDRQA